MKSIALALFVGLFFANIAIAGNSAGNPANNAAEKAVYVLDTPQLSCSYTSAEAKNAVKAEITVRLFNHVTWINDKTSPTYNIAFLGSNPSFIKICP